MVKDIKIMLGDAASNFSDELIELCYKHAITEIKEYCNRELDDSLEMVADSMAIVKLNRINTEGLSSQGFSGVTESYIDGYPAEIMAVLNRKRRLKVM